MALNGFPSLGGNKRLFVILAFRPASGAQGFAKYFQIIAWIRQIFPRIPLAVLLDFKGLQGKKGKKKFLQIFRSEAAPKRQVHFSDFER
jgi:hypothetical protein